jgi:hypothetical protein
MSGVWQPTQRASAEANLFDYAEQEGESPKDNSQFLYARPLTNQCFREREFLQSNVSITAIIQIILEYIFIERLRWHKICIYIRKPFNVAKE